MPHPPAEARLRRLLALVPWVAARDGPTLEEVGSRFGCTVEELAADLELLFLCGLHPYTPDTLIDVDVADGRVWIRYADYFARPLRLTPSEGLALLVAGRAALASPGGEAGGALGRGLDRLAAALGVAGDEVVDVALGAAPETVLATLTASLESRHQVELDYYSYGSDRWSRRVVEPSAVFHAEGRWYLAAYCQAAGDDRVFRLDRIHDATPLPTPFSGPSPEGEPSVFSPDPGDPRVTLEVGPAGRWVAEQYPTEEVEALEGGGRRVRLAVSRTPWLERLLLRLGPEARVVEGQDPAPAAAARILARYRSQA